MNNDKFQIKPFQQMISKAELKKELIDGKAKVILNIIGYFMLLIGSIGIYFSLFIGKISMGKININEKNLKKFSAVILVIIWIIFLIAEFIKLDDILKLN